MEHQSEWVCARVEVCVLCCNTEVTMTGRKKRKRDKKKNRPLHLIKGSLKHSSLSPYTVILLQALSHFSSTQFSPRTYC